MLLVLERPSCTWPAACWERNEATGRVLHMQPSRSSQGAFCNPAPPPQTSIFTMASWPLADDHRGNWTTASGQCAPPPPLTLQESGGSCWASCPWGGGMGLYRRRNWTWCLLLSLFQGCYHCVTLSLLKNSHPPPTHTRFSPAKAKQTGHGEGLLFLSSVHCQVRAAKELFWWKHSKKRLYELNTRYKTGPRCFFLKLHSYRYHVLVKWRKSML